MYYIVPGGPKKENSKEKGIADNKWPPDFNSSAQIFWGFIVKSENNSLGRIVTEIQFQAMNSYR